MSLLTLGTDPVLTMTLERPLRGSWTADLEVDADKAPTGKLALSGAGLSLVGTVVTSQSWNDRQRARLVAGAGGMRKLVKPAWHRSTTVRHLVKSILDSVGETLSPTVDASILGRSVAAWFRLGGTASSALDQVLARFSPLAIWRHLPDGTVWIGVPAWSTVETTALVQDNRGDEDTADLAGDDLSLDAGVTVLGRRVGLVRHRVQVGSLRSEAWWVKSEERGLVAALTSIVERLVGARIDLSRPYRARVVTQHADGSVDIVPSDPSVENARAEYKAAGVAAGTATAAREAAEAAVTTATPSTIDAANKALADAVAAEAYAKKFEVLKQRVFEEAVAATSTVIPPMTNVPIVYGQPGVRAEVKPGAAVFVEFLGGNASLPYVTGWVAGTVTKLTVDADEVRLADGDRPVARLGDLVSVSLPISAPVVSGSPVAWTPVPDPTPTAVASGIIVSGSSKAKAN